MMALYMALKIKDGRMKYSILKCKLYTQYKEDVDMILKAEGREDLIEDLD